MAEQSYSRYLAWARAQFVKGCENLSDVIIVCGLIQCRAFQEKLHPAGHKYSQMKTTQILSVVPPSKTGEFCPDIDWRTLATLLVSLVALLFELVVCACNIWCLWRFRWRPAPKTFNKATSSPLLKGKDVFDTKELMHCKDKELLLSFREVQPIGRSSNGTAGAFSCCVGQERWTAELVTKL